MKERRIGTDVSEFALKGAKAEKIMLDDLPFLCEVRGKEVHRV